MLNVSTSTVDHPLFGSTRPDGKSEERERLYKFSEHGWSAPIRSQWRKMVVKLINCLRVLFSKWINCYLRDLLTIMLFTRQNCTHKFCTLYPKTFSNALFVRNCAKIRLKKPLYSVISFWKMRKKLKRFSLAHCR